MKINLLCGVNTTGYGVAALNVLVGLARHHEVALHEIGPSECPPNRRDVVESARLNACNYDDDAPSVRIWHQNALAEHVGRGPRIGYSFFELDRLTAAEVHHINRLDVFCVASEWGRGVCRESGVTTPVHVVPLGVDRTIFHEAVPYTRLDPDHTVFLHVGKWEVRKGHDVLLSAFNKAFGRSDKVILRMLSHNKFIGQLNDEWAKLYKTSKLGDKIDIVAGRVPDQAAVAALMVSADVGVFPARGEAWNLDLLEMMSMGKEVIATRYSGHTAYCNAFNSHGIYISELEDAYDGIWFRGEGMWASLGPDQEEQLIEAMRHLHGRKQRGELRVNECGIGTAKRFSWENSADSLAAVVSDGVSAL